MSPGSRLGVGLIRGTGGEAARSLPLRYKKSARLNLLLLNLLNRVHRKISPPLRYKISARLNCLFCWALCISSSIHRYKRTSSLSPVV